MKLYISIKGNEKEPKLYTAKSQTQNNVAMEELRNKKDVRLQETNSKILELSPSFLLDKRLNIQLKGKDQKNRLKI